MSTKTNEPEVQITPLYRAVEKTGGTEENLNAIEADIEMIGLPITYPEGSALLLSGALLATFPSIQAMPEFHMTVQVMSQDLFMVGVDNVDAKPQPFPAAPEPVKRYVDLSTLALGEACILFGEAAREFADARKCCTSAEEMLTLAGKIHAMEQKKAQFEAIIAGQPWTPTPFEANHCLHCGDFFDKAPNDAVGLCNDCIPF